MCLAIPAEVIEIGDDDTAWADFGGVRREISLALLDGVSVGDYVIVHVGYALNRVDPEEAQATLALFEELGEAMGDPEAAP